MLEVFNVTDVDIAFPTAAKIPAKESIPKEFWSSHNKWNKVFSQWFNKGGKLVKVIPKEGVDKDRAMRAIHSVMGSFSPSHEHKEAAVSYMLSEWFDSFEIESKE